jgi:hypothetical protein
MVKSKEQELMPGCIGPGKERQVHLPYGSCSLPPSAFLHLESFSSYHICSRPSVACRELWQLLQSQVSQKCSALYEQLWLEGTVRNGSLWHLFEVAK